MITMTIYDDNYDHCFANTRYRYSMRKVTFVDDYDNNDDDNENNTSKTDVAPSVL